jgi:hypothetical protein
MWLPTKGMVDAAKRHVITAVGVAVTIFGLQAKGVSMENATALINALGDTATTILQVIAAAATIYGGIKAASTATPANRIADVRNLATGAASEDAVAAQAALIDATSAIAQDNTIPKSQEAKVALLDATAAMPEVIGTIRVTDPALEAATSSSQIKAAA